MHILTYILLWIYNINNTTPCTVANMCNYCHSVVHIILQIQALSLPLEFFSDTLKIVIL